MTFLKQAGFLPPFWHPDKTAPGAVHAHDNRTMIHGKFFPKPLPLSIDKKAQELFQPLGITPPDYLRECALKLFMRLTYDYYPGTAIRGSISNEFKADQLLSGLIRN